MAISAGMLAHLKSNCTFLCEVWKMTARDGTIAAYTNHTRNLTYNSQLYTAAPVEPSRITRKIGLEPDVSELTGALDAVITEADIVAGKWKRAVIVKDIVCYTDLTLGYALRQKGHAGSFSVRNGLFVMEFRSNSQLLGQTIGELTSPVDRNRTPEQLGVSMGAFTFARTVTAVASRRAFTVDGAAQADAYFRYGRAEWTTGANADLQMEVKDNIGNVITLQLPMPSDIAIGQTLNLIAGYDGTREQARDKFGATAVLNFNAEPDLPGIKGVLSYPE